MSAISRARQRAAELRSQATRIENERAARHGHAQDDLTSITVDDLGQLVSIDFSTELGHTTADRWATSLLAVHRQACAAVRVADPLPAPTAGVPYAGSPPPGPVTPGRPLAPEQGVTSDRTDSMVERFERFSTRQPELRLVGSADGVRLVFDGALGLREAHTTGQALGRGPAAMARAVVAAWRDAATQLETALDLERA